MRVSVFAVLMLVLPMSSFLAGCTSGDDHGDQKGGGQEIGPPEVAQPVQTLPDTSKLYLIDMLPIGTSYSEVQQRFSGVSERMPTAIGELSRATAPVQIMGRPAVLELNFERNTLYSYYYRLEELSCNEAQDLYERLKQVYEQRYGAYNEERETDGAYRAETSYWAAVGFDVVATYGNQSGSCRVAWGFQEQ